METTTKGPQRPPRKWLAHEDNALAKAVEMYGARNWKDIARQVPSRDQHQCRARWNKALRPGLKRGRWSREEDEVLIKYAAELNFDWRQISNRIPGRNPKQCKERWSHNLDPSINRNKWSPDEDRQLLQLYENYGSKWAKMSLEIHGRTENQVKSRYRTLQRHNGSKSKNTVNHIADVASNSNAEEPLDPEAINRIVATVAEKNQTTTATGHSKVLRNRRGVKKALKLLPMSKPKRASKTAAETKKGATPRSVEFSGSNVPMSSGSQVPMSSGSQVPMTSSSQVPVSTTRAKGVLGPSNNVPISDVPTTVSSWSANAENSSQEALAVAQLTKLKQTTSISVPPIWPPQTPLFSHFTQPSTGFPMAFTPIPWHAHHLAEMQAIAHSVAIGQNLASVGPSAASLKRPTEHQVATAGRIQPETVGKSSVGTSEPLLKKPRTDLPKMQASSIKVPAEYYRGVSLQLVEDFWKRVVGNVEHPEVLLLETTKASTVILDTNGDAGLVRPTTVVKQILPAGRTILLNSKRSLNRWIGTEPTLGRISFRPSSVRKKRRDEWTINDIAKHIIEPDVKANNCSFLDVVAKQYDAESLKTLVGAPFKGTYVSFSWETKMSHLIEALQGHISNSTASDQQSPAFVWLDIFAWEHMSTDKSRTEYRNLVHKGVHAAIAQFDDCVVMLSSWEDPLALKRTWSIWEMYGAATNGRGFRVCLTETVAARFADALVHSYDKLVQAIINVDVPPKSGYSQSERDKITNSVREQLREWFASTASDFCKDAMSNREYLEEPDFVFRLLSRTARLLKDQSKYQQAEVLYNSALRVATTLRQTQHPKHPAYHTTLTSLAGVYLEQGKLAESSASYAEALEVIESEMTLDCSAPPPPASASLTSLGGDLEVEDRTEGTAVSSTYWARRMEEDTARIYHNRGRLLQEQGNYKAAKEDFGNALEIRKRLFGDAHPDYASTLHWMGDLLLATGQEAEAKATLEEAQRKSSVAYKSLDHPKYADILISIARLRFQEKSFEDAERLFLDAKRVLQRVCGERHAEYAKVLRELANVYGKQGKPLEAEKLLERAMVIMKDLFGTHHVKYAEILSDLGALLENQQRYKEAEKVLVEACLILKNRQGGSDKPGHYITKKLLADVEMKLGQRSDAAVLYDEVLEPIKETMGDESVEYLEVLESLGSARKQSFPKSKAKEVFIKETKCIPQATQGCKESQSANTSTRHQSEQDSSTKGNRVAGRVVNSPELDSLVQAVSQVSGTEPGRVEIPLDGQPVRIQDRRKIILSGSSEQ